MKIALVHSLATETVHVRLAEALASDLAKHGASVESFALTASTIDVAMGLSALCEHAPRFDLLHSVGRLEVVAVAGLFQTPVVATLPSRVTDDEKEVLRVRGSRATLVAVDDHARRAGLTVASMIPLHDLDHAVRAYAELYLRVIGRDRARRVDHVHDTRPWGEYWVLADAPDFKVKRILVLPGKRLSYQSHERRAEHWVVVQGRAKVTLDGRELELAVGGTVAIPQGAAHRIENVGDGPLTFVEVQTGTYFGEDDIRRLADDFGRAL